MGSLILFIILAVIYFIPTLIAYSREHRNIASIFVVNLFLGWSFIGWVAALVWSFTNNQANDQDKNENVTNEITPTSENPNKADEYLSRLEKLADLKTKGAITEEEFQQLKAQLNDTKKNSVKEI